MKNRKKIMFVITKSNLGGAQRYVLDLARALQQNENYEVAVALGGNGILIEKLRHAGIRALPIDALGRDINPLLDFAALRELAHLFQGEAPDVVHLNSSKVGILGALAAWRAHVPRVIFTAHAWAFNDPRLSFPVRALAYPLHMLTILLCDVIIAVSEKTRAQIAWLPFISRKVTVIRNGVGAVRFLEREDARKAMSTHGKANISSTFLIGTLAELHPIKGLSYLIDAMKIVHEKHADTALIIFGEGDHRKKLQKQINDANLENVVTLAGFRADAPSLLKGLDLFVLPSLSEALGYAVLEAGLAGLPVVATNAGGIPEIIASDVTGTLVPPKDSAALAKAINTYHESPDLRRAHADALQKQVLKEFTREHMLQETVSLYQN